MGDVSPERVLRALRKDPKLLSGVMDLVIAEGLITPPEPEPVTELKLVEHHAQVVMERESEYCVLSIPDEYPAGYYFVRMQGAHGTSPQGRIAMHSRHGLEARQVSLSRTHLESETYVGVCGFSVSDKTQRSLTVRGKPHVEGVPLVVFPEGGSVTIQWIGEGP